MDSNDLIIGSYLRALRVKRRSPETIRLYERVLQRLQRRYPDRDLTDLTKADLEQHLLTLLDGEMSAATAATHFRILHTFYAWAEKEELVERTPMLRMQEPQPDTAPVPVIAEQHIRALLKVCSGSHLLDRRDTAIIRLWLEAGSPRLSEMAGIQLEDLDMSLDQVTVHGKGGLVRLVPFGAKTGQAIDRYLRARVRAGYAKTPQLWVAESGKGLGTAGLSKMLTRRCKQASIPPINPHRFRHTAAHLWAQSDGSEQDAMALFGWRSRRMPHHYGKSAGAERARDAARRRSIADRF